MLGVLSNIVVALFVLGIIIVIHEGGHFMVAKLFRIRVETFSVGFGPRLFGYRYGDTDYRISALPLGGYVKMSGENPGEEVTGDPYEFTSKPKWQRFLVAFAGPAMNGILAVGLMTGLFMYGMEVPDMPDETRVGAVAEGSPAEAAGILPGDVILELDGEASPTWRDVEIEVVMSPERALPVRLERDGEIIETTLTPERRGVNEAGYAGWGSHFPVVVQRFTREDSPAERAGLRPGDEIVAVGDTVLETTSRPIEDIIQGIPSGVIPLTVLRDAETLYLDVEPEINEDGRRVMGFYYPNVPTVMLQLGLVDAVSLSLQENASYALLIFDLLGRMIRREASARSIDGPIGLVNMTGQFLDQGLAQLISLMALISLNLGVINLLPIPILDGGVMMLLAIEGIMRQDLSLAVKERIAQVSFVFLLTLIVFVLYNDVVKLTAN